MRLQHALAVTLALVLGPLAALAPADEKREAAALKLFESARKHLASNPTQAEKKLQQLNKKFADTELWTEKQKEIRALEAKCRAALWPGASNYRGEVLLPEEGLLRLTYPFDKTTELGDFSGGKKPSVTDGALTATSTRAPLRSKARFSTGGPLKVRVEGQGRGKIALLLTDGDDDENAAEAPKIELTAGLKKLDVEVTDGQGGTQSASVSSSETLPWSVEVTWTSEGALSVVTAMGASTQSTEGQAGERKALRPGLVFMSGKVRVERLVLEGPIPAENSGGTGSNELPRGVWIPLAERGLDGWQRQGKVVAKAPGHLAHEGGKLTLWSKDTEGAQPESYTFACEVFVEASGRAARAKTNGVGFTIVLPLGEGLFGWSLAARNQTIPGTDLRHLTSLPPNQWVSLTAKVTPSGFEATMGGRTTLACPIEKLAPAIDHDPAGKLKGIGFFITDNNKGRRYEIQNPRIRVD
ncbi:MAG: hypothetical protein ACYS22_20850 [Planctomycetota bacterium]|jgi:hypothetical protein